MSSFTLKSGPRKEKAAGRRRSGNPPRGGMDKVKVPTSNERPLTLLARSAVKEEGESCKRTECVNSLDLFFNSPGAETIERSRAVGGEKGKGGERRTRRSWGIKKGRTPSSGTKDKTPRDRKISGKGRPRKTKVPKKRSATKLNRASLKSHVQVKYRSSQREKVVDSESSTQRGQVKASIGKRKKREARHIEG